MKSLVKEVSWDFLNYTRCAVLPISSLLATLITISVLKSLFNKTAIISSIAKSDEIGKKAHLVWLKEVSRDFVN